MDSWFLCPLVLSDWQVLHTQKPHLVVHDTGTPTRMNSRGLVKDYQGGPPTVSLGLRMFTQVEILGTSGS